MCIRDRSSHFITVVYLSIRNYSPSNSELPTGEALEHLSDVYGRDRIIVPQLTLTIGLLQSLIILFVTCNVFIFMGLLQLMLSGIRADIHALRLVVHAPG